MNLFFKIYQSKTFFILIIYFCRVNRIVISQFHFPFVPTEAKRNPEADFLNIQINNSGKEVEAAQLELESSSKTTTMELQGQEFWPLSGKPYFHVVLSKSNLKPSYHLVIT